MSKIELYAPKNYNELSYKQHAFILKLFEANMSESEFLISAWLMLTNTKILDKQIYKQGVFYYYFRHKKRKFLLTADEVDELSKQVNWLLSDSTLTNVPFAYFKTKCKKYYAPANNLYNITLSEFIFCETNFLSFCKSKYFTYLHNLIAILYRKQVKPYLPNSVDYNGDRREPFNDHLFRSNAKKISKMNKIKKLMIYNYYAGCRNALQKEFPLVFANDTPTTNTKSVNMSKNIMSLISATNGGDPTKNKQLLNTNVREILIEIEMAHKRINEIKK